MEDYIGKVCPYCNGEITQEDEAHVCEVCGAVHHKKCWDERGGCSNHCVSNAGTKINEPQALSSPVCPACGEELEAGRNFCPKCGRALSEGFAPQQAKKSKKLPLIIGLCAVGVVAVILVVVLLLGGKPNFTKITANMDSKFYSVATDGLSLKVDSNPYDIDDYYSQVPIDMISEINDALGLPDSLWEEMASTRSIDGRQIEVYDKVTVSWTYHPDDGLEILYKIND